MGGGWATFIDKWQQVVVDTELFTNAAAAFDEGGGCGGDPHVITVCVLWTLPAAELPEVRSCRLEGDEVTDRNS